MPDDLDAVVERTRLLQAENQNLKNRVAAASARGPAERAPTALSAVHWAVLVLCLIATGATLVLGVPVQHVTLPFR
jgi:hypothetical protein